MLIETLPATQTAAAVALWHETGLTRPWNDPAADLTRALNGPSSTVLAAVDGHRGADNLLIGTVMVGHDGHRGWAYYLAVSPSRRRHGIGRALMHTAEQWLAGRVPKLQLMVRSENAAAAQFYQQLGYTPSDVLVLARWIDRQAD
ncbi:GNAT family acetyltransferase [Actinomycetospora endophytica]|uniref:GNAT family acetyltransferase n=1 Tax=Actinomycetospora endophytica TaxID=2291215 RepID=A0ABS8P2S5_9PSEU|nr:GNAT family acetyltransferase [Actinomycetospora endophytica]MCD2191870.1 GNAT family acetyltransferase [Actinomycetospora endophytica]